MNDLIDRQAAIDALNKLKIYRPLDSDRYVISDCLNKIVNLPSAQPEIIRCKDCRYYKTYQYVNGIRKFLPKCSFNDIYVAEEDFCSQAERRQDE